MSLNEVGYTKKNKTINRKKKVKTKKIKFNPKKFILENIVEIALMATGLIFFIQPSYSNVKLSFTLLFIGSFLLLFLYKKEDLPKELDYSGYKRVNFLSQKASSVYYFREQMMSKEEKLKQKIDNFKARLVEIKNLDLTFSDKIVLGLIIWTLILFFITSSNQFEIYFVLIFLSILFTKEFTNAFTTSILKRRMNGFILVFIMAYVYIVFQKFTIIS